VSNDFKTQVGSYIYKNRTLLLDYLEARVENVTTLEGTATPTAS
jgi:hypothetical protein